MLCLDTCTAEASSSPTTVQLQFTFNPETHNVQNLGSFSTGYISNGTGSIQGFGGWGYYVKEGMYHFKIPFVITKSASDFNLSNYNPDNYYVSSAFLGAPSVNTGKISSFGLYDKSGNLICVPNGPWQILNANTGWKVQNSDASGTFKFSFIVEFDYIYDDSVIMFNSGTGAGSDPPQVDTVSPTISFYLDTVVDPTTEKLVSIYQEDVSDTVTQENTKETADNTSGILSKITDFFGSFFENLIGIFVPEDGYFSEWFNKVNTLLSDKLGMLYAPFDLVISTLQAIYSADSSESGIPFPGIKWEDTWLVEPFTFTFASLGDSFDDLRDKVYFATDTVLVFTFFMLLQSKVKLILEGHE